MTPEELGKAPFNLDSAGIGWVRSMAARLSPLQRIAQLFNIAVQGPVEETGNVFADLQPGGITRFFGHDGRAEIELIDTLQGKADVPLLVSADLEGSRMSLAFGTVVPNPLALAAIDDVEATRRISQVMAREARAVGVNWSFTPVLDINAAFRSAIVATRGFGSDPSLILRHSLAQIEEFQKLGLAACVKHWPGEGFDDRDQHLVTTINPLTLDEWEDNFGRLYRGAIRSGVLSVMSAHIAFPAFVRLLDPAAAEEAFLPASASPLLNEMLLRRRLGFNGVIVSDASEMAGLTSIYTAREAKVALLRAGCDMVLFTSDFAADVAAIQSAIDSGYLPQSRVDDALTRVLGLKAALGLHKRAWHDSSTQDTHARLAELASDDSVSIAREQFARAPTRVKDLHGLFPISPESHHRIYFVSGGIISPMHGTPETFALPGMLTDRGFHVTEYKSGDDFDPAGHDLVMYALGEETLLTRGRIFLDWLRLTGDFRQAMRRPWTRIPTVLVSFGYPYYLYDAPRVPACINAYSTCNEMQEAALDCMMGVRPFSGVSPVDAFCGLEDARY